MLLNLFIPVCLFILEGVRSQERCGVFEPFRVSPERAKVTDSTVLSLNAVRHY